MPRSLRPGALWAAVALAGCAAVPPRRSAIDAVSVEGNHEVDESDITDKLATTESPKFFGIFRGFVYDYELFNRLTLQRDLARVERYYRARGFYEAHARAGDVLRTSDDHVQVQILVDEGEPVRIRKVALEGLDSLTPEGKKRLQHISSRDLALEDVFEEEAFETAETSLLHWLTDHGYARAKVERDAVVDLPQHAADIVFKVEPGPLCTFGDVTIEGLAGLPEPPVRRALDLKPGDPYSSSDLEAARQAALDLGVFNSVLIVPALDVDKTEGSAPRTIPLRVVTEPAKLRTVRLGGGVEFDAIKTDVHALIGWEDHNFFGGMRRLSVTFRPGVVFYPLTINNWVMPQQLMPEFRLRSEFRQPGLFEARTNGFIRPELNLFPVLLGNKPQPGSPVTGYLEFKGAVGVDRVFWKLFTRLSENVQVEHPLSYRNDKDPNLRNVFISYPELVTTLDLSDSRVRPHKGAFITNTVQVAGGPFGGDATDVSVQPDARGYIPLGRHATFAARGALGFLFPSNYGISVEHPDDPANLDPAARTKDLQLVFFRGLFAGGPNSNRGYPLRGIGPFGVVPYLTPAARGSGACASVTDVQENCRVPVGGFTRWEASVEVRFDVTGPFSIGTFCDAADVSPTPADIRFRFLHLSCGAGARYDTPVGPIRLDAGYRIPGLQVIGPNDPQSQEPDKLFGVLPVALAFGIGEAF